MTSLADARNCKTAAKGNITKVFTQIKELQSLPHERLSLTAIQRQLDNLQRADNSFQTHLETILKVDDDYSQEQHDAELGDHLTLVDSAKEKLTELKQCHEARVALAELDYALEALEVCCKEGYDPSMDTQLEEVQQLATTFRKCASTGLATRDTTLKHERNLRTARILNIQKAKCKTKVDCSSSADHVAREVRVQTPALQLKLPTFDGDLLKWRDFWELFSAVLDKEVSLTDKEKCCHLIASMSTPDAKAKAEAAIAYSASYPEAVRRLKADYELNRVVHSHHLNELLQSDVIKDSRSDLQRLLDRIERSVRGLKNSNGFTAEQLIPAFCEGLMAPSLVKQWRKYSAKHSDPPPLEDLRKFLGEQIKATPESLYVKKEKDPASKPKHSFKHGAKTVLNTQPADKCPLCSSNHILFLCSQFRDKTPQQRKEIVDNAGVCVNCLSTRHKADECTSAKRCKECSGRHHTMIHVRKSPARPQETAETVNLTQGNGAIRKGPSHVVPRTAIVRAQAHGLQQKARAQLDSGASITLITSRLATTLKAPKVPNSALRISGVGGIIQSPHMVEVILLGTKGEELPIQAQVVDSIPHTSSPADVKKIQQLPFVQGLRLADPDYTSAARVDILLDMGNSNVCSLKGVLFSDIPGLKAENTIFGWTIGGTASTDQQNETLTSTCLKAEACEEEPDRLLRRFWELEQLPVEECCYTSEEQQAITHFQNTVQRDDDGRYRVSLPRRYPTPQLGRSRETALRRYNSNERSLKRQGAWNVFNQAILEYAELGHAERVPQADQGKPPELSYYLPMHGVVKSSSTTTKLRAVCDASAKTTTGVSLNDTLLTGPSLYPLLTTIVNRFRQHNIGMTADISKMFREVGLNKEEMDYHRFLHKSNSGVVEDWRMSRLTFGVSASPYLATQVLRQLAQDHREEFPIAARIVESAFYVDDCLTGADNIQQAMAIRTELNSLLAKGCMTLRKWRASSEQLLATIPDDLKERTDLHISTSPGECQKTLGLHWSTSADSLHVSTPEVLNKKATKRYVVSIVARIFDALGWFTPATLPAKLIIQEAWSLKIGWDDVLPDALQEKWSSWTDGLPSITSHPISRHLGSSGKKIAAQQLHGFSDASTLAYGGVVYLRTLHTDTSVTVNLIMSKVRVAPLKELTVPRLELCAALVLAILLKQVTKDLNIPPEAVFAWSDSSAVLGWMHKAPTRLPVFVANRIAKIHDLIDSSQWRYVETHCNPADLLSRGVPPKELLSTQLWWSGPPWLHQEPSLWPRRPDINFDRELPELKPTVLAINAAVEEFGTHISSFTKLVRVTAWIWRFYQRSKMKQKSVPSSHLTLAELSTATTLLLKHSQRVYYGFECSLLAKKKELPVSHTLAGLTPYLDEQGLLRVGGRLQKSSLSGACAHPIILSSKSHLVLLLVRHTHQVLLHAGPSTVISTMAQTYHIPRLKKLLRKISRTCVPCQRAYAHTSRQMMGELPAARVRPARPFSQVGLDFAGPFLIKRGNPRKPTLIKAYICVFVCFVSRAVHLEVVSDLTTEAFLATLNRFVARRGYPSDIFSDNGANFVGAKKEILKLQGILGSDQFQQKMIHWAAHKDIHWHFSPARAPHFGGLWEAAVRSMKTLLRKTIGEKSLTYEELTTVVTEAEAILNSRPLIHIEAPADDGISPLTPGHFLVGGPLAALPSHTDTLTKISALRRWNLIKRLNHDLWQRWKSEYLLHMQHRNKWKRRNRNLNVGDIVLLKDTDTFQRTWPMGRVSKVYPGSDNHIRVVDITIQGKTYRRPIHKLVYLLGEEDETSPRGEDVRAT